VKTRLPAVGATLVVTTLAAVAALATAGPAHAVDNASITVTVIDQFGRVAVGEAQPGLGGDRGRSDGAGQTRRSGESGEPQRDLALGGLG
jgi:hypothetical protein